MGTQKLCMAAVSLTLSEINEISFVYNSALAKMFNIYDKQNIAYCQCYSGYLAFE